MSKKTVYFGTRAKMSWVKAPVVNMLRTNERVINSGTYTNGGGYVMDGTGSHENYDLSWSLTDTADIDLVQAYYNKIYGSDLIYWLDPFVCARNALPLAWSVPSLGADDAPTLFQNIKPTLVNTATNSLGLPTQSARYTLGAFSVGKSVWIPVPDGSDVAFGFIGSATGNGVLEYAKDSAPTTWITINARPATVYLTVDMFVKNVGGGVTVRTRGTTGTFTLTALTVKVGNGDIGWKVNTWNGAAKASASTQVTSEGQTFINLQTNPLFTTTTNIPVGMTREQVGSDWFLVNPAPAARGYGRSPYGRAEYGY